MKIKLLNGILRHVIGAGGAAAAVTAGESTETVEGVATTLPADQTQLIIGLGMLIASIIWSLIEKVKGDG